jgi:hypothetical protein
MVGYKSHFPEKTIKKKELKVLPNGTFSNNPKSSKKAKSRLIIFGCF